VANVAAVGVPIATMPAEIPPVAVDTATHASAEPATVAAPTARPRLPSDSLEPRPLPSAPAFAELDAGLAPSAASSAPAAGSASASASASAGLPDAQAVATDAAVAPSGAVPEPRLPLGAEDDSNNPYN
jgi:hypothetical protein